MILSNVAIQRALDDGDLVLDPEPHPRRPTAPDATCPYDTTTVNLRLSPRLQIAPSEPPPMTFDLRRPGIGKLLNHHYRALAIDPLGGYSLQPRAFVLGQTIERVHLPIREGRPVLAARVEGRSSFARCGLIVHFTAPTIHAGFDGTITLEMINLGPCPIALYPDMEIVQLVVEQVLGTPFHKPSQFQGQATPAGA